MISVSAVQMQTLREQALQRFPDRVLAHWRAEHPRLVACFSAEERQLIVDKVIAWAQTDAIHSEASLVLHADIWLHELAARRGFQR